MRLTVGGQVTNDNLVLKLLPNATLSGKVLDENGDPVPLAMVTVMRRAIVSGRSQIQVMGGGSTDDAGQYRIRIPQGGDYYVRAVSTRTPFSTSAVAQWAVPLYCALMRPRFTPARAISPPPF
jgi:protocatechuate 3,4-dioxygenase beta subunit